MRIIAAIERRPETKIKNNEITQTIVLANTEKEKAPLGVIFRWENVIASSYFLVRSLPGVIGRIFSEYEQSRS
jgi:hypothetical protein